MRKIYLLVLCLFITGGYAYTQTPVTWSDDFEDNTIDTAYWKNNAGIYEIAEAGGVLTYTVTKQSMWDGVFLTFPDDIDLSANPLASIRIKADTALDFRIYLWDENETDTLYNRSNADVWVVPGETFHTYYFSWAGKFQHATNVDGEEEIFFMDSTSIDGFLINVDPGVDDPLYSGVMVFDDVKVGAAAEIPFAEAMITSSAIGSVGATVISDIPEGTTVQPLLDGITHNGDDLLMLASGFPGKAGVEAEGSDVLDASMDLVVILEGSNPRKFNILVAPPALPCYYREDFPNVDAEVDPVWETVPVVDMGLQLNGTENIAGPTDLSATFRTLWDEVSLFFLVEVKDETKKMDSGFPTPYADDCVEVWLDLNNSKNSSYLPSETDEFQIMWLRDDAIQHQVDHNDMIDGMSWAWTDTQDGYRFEVEIPWLTSLLWLDRFGTQQPEIGHKVGFEIHVNDDDDEDPGRDSNIGWFYPEDQAWTDPSTFGDMQMKGEITESVNSLNNNFKFRMYPNPASETLQLISNRGISQVEVVNLIGQQVLNLNAGKNRLVNLDIAALPNSIYLVTIRDESGRSSTMKFLKK